jgi:hypothetical protein
MSAHILQENITQLLGIDTLSPEEQASFLSEVGDVIFQTSLVRLATDLAPEQQQSLEQYLDTEPEPEVLMQHLLEHYKEFKRILEEVVIEFKEDALAVLAKKEDDIKIIDA